MHLSIAVIVILTGYGGHGPGGSPAPPLWQQPRAFSLAAGAQQAARVASPKLLPGVAEAVNKGFDLLGRNDAAGAEAAFRQAIDLQPEVEMAHRGLGLALRAGGRMRRPCANWKWRRASTLRTRMRITRWRTRPGL